MPTTLLLLRHGATGSNVVQPYVLQGSRTDTELIAAGIVQAKQSAEFLASRTVRRIYCSPLQRSLATARIIADRLDTPLDVVEGLVEADVGLWSGLNWTEIESRWPDAHRAFHDDAETQGYLGGENLAQVRDRTLPLIHQLCAAHVGQTIVIVAHGVVNRTLLAHWLGLPLRHSRRLPQDNAGINTIEVADNSARVRTINATAHLETAGEPGLNARDAGHETSTKGESSQ